METKETRGREKERKDPWRNLVSGYRVGGRREGREKGGRGEGLK